MTAAYRWFDNPKAGFQPILPPHMDATRRRIAAQPVVLLVQDTTELELTRPQQQVEGAGPLDSGSRRGVFLHPRHAFTPEGTPLGTLAAVTWAREEGVVCAQQSRQERAPMPIAQKGSVRWVEMLRRARPAAASCPNTQLGCVADSEADIYELLAAAAAEPCHVLKGDGRVEQRRFATRERFLSCLAVYGIVVGRTRYVCRLGWSCPEIACEAVFEPAEWKAVWQVTHGRRPPKKPPTLGALVVCVAQLVGYVPRAGSAPGPQTVWLGLQRTYDFAWCWRTFGPEAKRGPQDV